MSLIRSKGRTGHENRISTVGGIDLGANASDRRGGSLVLISRGGVEKVHSAFDLPAGTMRQDVS
jgi:hypothetical protein